MEHDREDQRRPGHAAAGAASESRTSAAGSTGSMAGADSSMGASGSRSAEDAKRYAQDMAGRAKEKGKSVLEQGKGAAASQLEAVAHAFHRSAEQLQGGGQAQVGGLVDLAADRLEYLGRQLREKNMDDLMREAQNIGRRAPGMLFAGSLAAGFLLARFLKSSAERREDTWSNDLHRNASRGGVGARPGDGDWVGGDVPGPGLMAETEMAGTRAGPGMSSAAAPLTGNPTGVPGSSGPTGQGLSGAGSGNSGSTSYPTSNPSISGGNSHGTR